MSFLRRRSTILTIVVLAFVAGGSISPAVPPLLALTAKEEVTVCRMMCSMDGGECCCTKKATPHADTSHHAKTPYPGGHGAASVASRSVVSRVCPATGVVGDSLSRLFSAHLSERRLRFAPEARRARLARLRPLGSEAEKRQRAQPRAPPYRAASFLAS